MKVTARLDKRFADKQGKFPIKVTISQHGQTAHIPLGVSVTAQQWDTKLCKIVAHPQKAQLNMTIEQRVFDYRQKATAFCIDCRARGYIPTAIEIRDAITGTESSAPMLYATYERFLSTKQDGNTLKSYTQTYRKIAQYVGPDDAQLDSIDVGWLEDFDDYMRRGGLSTNGRAVHHRNLRALLNYAVKRRLMTFYPYQLYHIKTEPTPHRDLPLEDFRRVATIPLPEHLAKWRDLFLLSFCLAGMNIKDLSLLKQSNIKGDRLQYVRAKTLHPFSFPLTPQTEELIDRLKMKEAEDEATKQSRPSPQNTQAQKQKQHDKPLLAFSATNYRNANKRMNKALARIAEHLSIQPFTSYAARHSFASIAAHLAIPQNTIADLLGHTRTVTDIYIHYDSRLADDALRRVIDEALPR